MRALQQELQAAEKKKRDAEERERVTREDVERQLTECEDRLREALQTSQELS